MRDELTRVIAASTNPRIPRIRAFIALSNAVMLWQPLINDILSLFAETCECEHLPLYETDPTTGKLLFSERNVPKLVQYPACSKHRPVGCGWPLQNYPPDWFERAAVMLKVASLQTSPDISSSQLISAHLNRLKRLTSVQSLLH